MHMKKDDFTHNNMVPFFGGTMKQNTNDNASKNILESFTGRSEFDKHKKEQVPLFKPTTGYTNINGSKNVDLTDRYNTSRYIKSEFNQTSDNKQIDINESNARDLVLKIIKLSL